MTFFTSGDKAPNQAESKEAAKSSSSSNKSSIGERNTNDDGDDDDDEDAWDKRIKTTGCFKENEALLICHADTGDWRKCLAEMNAFKQCMKRNGRFSEDP
ncbi:hypothetical protein LPJ56_005481 [Coemansia sp. RSA 2599]|nr:hypothetical protein LPJ56_005481 [Coemansia sp. RSA 2599]